MGYEPELVELANAASARAAPPIDARFVPLTKLSLTAMWLAALPNDPAPLLVGSGVAMSPGDWDAVWGGATALDALRFAGEVCATETLGPALACGS